MNDGSFLITKINMFYKVCFENHKGWVDYMVYSNVFPDDDSCKVDYLKGSIKMDGCSNWMFLVDKDCMLHACTRDELSHPSFILESLYDHAVSIGVTSTQGE